jgi:uncharacterized membrane protein
MSQLLVAVYEGEQTAEHVLGVLQAQGDALAASLESAAVFRHQRDSSFTMIRTEPSGSSGSFWGVFWEVLFGLVFRAPDRSPTSTSNLGQLFETIERAGLDERFRARVRRALSKGKSALGLFALNWNTESLINAQFLRPEELVRVHLSPEQDVELLNELGRFRSDE